MIQHQLSFCVPLFEFLLFLCVSANQTPPKSAVLSYIVVFFFVSLFDACLSMLFFLLPAFCCIASTLSYVISPFSLSLFFRSTALLLLLSFVQKKSSKW